MRRDSAIDVVILNVLQVVTVPTNNKSLILLNLNI